ncbi:MAG: hypothetical protein RIT27_976 [Pseudomonadota bacterium]|jgi:hypothetical protein
MHWEIAIRQLCQARVEVLAAWLHDEKRYLLISLGLLIMGGAMYGASLGVWRDPLQAFYVAIKFPLLLGLTALGNALINGMLAQLLGASISFRQSLLAILMSYALLAIILGAFAPLSWFLVWHLPAMGSLSQTLGYDLYLLTNVVLIIFAGLIANSQLYRLLVYICQDALKAKQILIAWLIVNLFLGAQLSWNLRPFFGSPHLVVKFLRDNPFDGSFYEAIFYIVINYMGA